jgi:hypothetical protein
MNEWIHMTEGEKWAEYWWIYVPFMIACFIYLRWKR